MLERTKKALVAHQERFSKTEFETISRLSEVYHTTTGENKDQDAEAVCVIFFTDRKANAIT